jgi:hypothetical protein
MEERQLTDGVAYHKGKRSPSNMTPRLGEDTDPDDPQRGLSAHMDPKKAIPAVNEGEEPRTFIVSKIDISMLSSLQAFLDGTGHVAIRPSEQAALEEWAESKGWKGQEMHPWTVEVREAVTGFEDVSQ